MPGFSLTVLLLPRGESTKFSADQIIGFLDAGTDAPGWPWHARAEPTLGSPTDRDSVATQEQSRGNLPVLKRASF
jgi:hypothetical protein